METADVSYPASRKFLIRHHLCRCPGVSAIFVSIRLRPNVSSWQISIKNVIGNDWQQFAQRTGDEKFNRAARFRARIFGLNFAVRVVSGIPMEFQFGTNWAGFFQYVGAIIGQTLAMEGMFAFFLDSPAVFSRSQIHLRY
jgi:Cytochrome bd terminal oxidase subunit I